MADNKISLPGAFGGLMRYDEEYESKIKISPLHVMAFIIVIVLFVIALKLFWPIAG